MAHLSLKHKGDPVGAIQKALKKSGAKSENPFIEALSEVDLKPVVTRSLETPESNGSRYRINIEESGAAWDPPQDHRSLHVLSWVC